MTDNNQFQRTEMLIGEEALERLKKSAVLVFGLGGVGSYVCEALVRAGVGKLEIVDKDVVDITNINRQLIALHSTIGRAKADVEAERLMDINPSLDLTVRKCFYLPENSDEFDFGKFDYVVDAIDNVTAKLDIIEKSKKAGTKVISSMGTGNKLDPSAFRIADIEDTKICPLARVMRKELRKRGINGVKVLYSQEEPKGSGGRTPASISFVPSVAGLLIAKTVIDDLYVL
ncbi:MAG: ThiF family adenylyltransferase [Candidatus Fimisoma sp.]